MRVDRLLSMLLIIAKKSTVTGKELADHFEVSLRTIYRDIDKLGEAGIPIASIGGKGGGYYLMENYHVDNLFLNKKEAHTVMDVMNNLSLLFGKDKEFHDLVLKIENTYKRDKNADKLSINMSHFSMERELKEYLFLTDKAIEENKLLVFDYINRSMEYFERTVEPVQIAFTDGQWYLIAFCRKRNDYRRFKLVRIKNLRMGNIFDKRDTSTEEIQKIIEESYQERGITVTLKFSSRMGEQLPEHFQKENIHQTEDNQFIVVDQFPYEEGLLKFILSFGKECEIIEPRYLREEFMEYVKELLLPYNG
ncbi:transcriptional regulator [Brevibacillus choshinensis]|uniref:Transcriptional regulator n=1 Tax=Brevibacillus choshinensis TaxID=54911 RepID=A0ABR5N5B3_BRECH|nr:YafY family protein [Brevibacillus choshinensis]KQL45795.1 transcriptional regulator [Brevibacillus choshinensis]